MPTFLVTLVLGIAVMYLLNRVRRQTTLLRALQTSVDTVQASQLCNDDISELCSGAVRDAQRSWINRKIIIPDHFKDGSTLRKEDTERKSPTVDDTSCPPRGEEQAPRASEGVNVEEATGPADVD